MSGASALIEDSKTNLCCQFYNASWLGVRWLALGVCTLGQVWGSLQEEVLGGAFRDPDGVANAMARSMLSSIRDPRWGAKSHVKPIPRQCLTKGQQIGEIHCHAEIHGGYALHDICQPLAEVCCSATASL